MIKKSIVPEIINPVNGNGEEIKIKEIDSIRKADLNNRDKKVGIVILTKEAMYYWEYNTKEERDKDYERLRNA